MFYMILFVETSKPGMGKGRDGTVPRFFVPQTSVPVPRDTKSVGTDRDSLPAGQSR